MSASNKKCASEGGISRLRLFVIIAAAFIVAVQTYGGTMPTKGLREVYTGMVLTSDDTANCVKALAIDEIFAAPVKGLLSPPQEPFQCSAEQTSTQSESWCRHFAGRHNLKPFWKLLRFHMPDARTFADVGANKGLVSARFFNLWSSTLRPSSTLATL
jgi:hypothetical protein